MKCPLLLFPFLVLSLSSFAQNGFDSRAYKVPAISYSSKKPIGTNWVMPGGESIFVSAESKIITPSKLSATNSEWFFSIADYQVCSFFGSLEKILRSPNGRFVVNQCIGCRETLPDKSGSTTFSQKSKIRSTINKGHVTTAVDTPWAWCNVEKDYVLAVTNEGRIITTDPADVDLDKNRFKNVESGEVIKMKGLWLVDPKTGKRQTIREDVIKQGSGKGPQVLLNADGSQLLLVTSPKEKLFPKAFIHQFNTSNNIELPWVYGTSVQQIGKTLILVTDEKKKNIVYRLADAVKMLEHIPSDTLSEDLFLTENDELCFYNDSTGSIVVFKAAGDEMKLHERFTLKQDGVLSKEVGYSFLVMKDHVALMPKHLPPGMRQWPDGFDWEWGATKKEAYPVFFDRKTGNATGMMRPYYAMLPTKAEAEASRKQRCKDLEKMMTWKIGSMVCSKTSVYETNKRLAGVDCEKLAYKLDEPSGASSLWVYSLGDYSLCAAPGEFNVCPKCKGVPHSTTELTVADDGWKQVNFNVYVRNPNKTKTEYVVFNCDLCKGKGFTKK